MIALAALLGAALGGIFVLLWVIGLVRAGVVVDDVDVFVLDGEVRRRVYAGELVLIPPTLFARPRMTSAIPQPAPGGVQ